MDSIFVNGRYSDGNDMLRIILTNSNDVVEELVTSINSRCLFNGHNSNVSLLIVDRQKTPVFEAVQETFKVFTLLYSGHCVILNIYICDIDCIEKPKALQSANKMLCLHDLL